jgi:hypothetical protein
MLFKDRFLEVGATRGGQPVRRGVVVVVGVCADHTQPLSLPSLPSSAPPDKWWLSCCVCGQYLLTSYSDDSVSYTWNEYSLDQQQDFVDSMTGWQVRDRIKSRLCLPAACMHRQVNWIACIALGVLCKPTRLTVGRRWLCVWQAGDLIVIWDKARFAESVESRSGTASLGQRAGIAGVEGVDYAGAGRSCPVAFPSCRAVTFGGPPFSYS